MTVARNEAQESHELVLQNPGIIESMSKIVFCTSMLEVRDPMLVCSSVAALMLKYSSMLGDPLFECARAAKTLEYARRPRFEHAQASKDAWHAQ